MTTNRIAAVSVSLMIIAALAAIVLVAIGANRLGDLVVGVFAVGVIGVALAAVFVNLYSRASASRAQREELLYNHAEAMAKAGLMINDRRALVYTPLSMAALPAPVAQQQSEIDPRHDLLINLCLLTIKSSDYGPMSNRLMTADDAQADRSGQFADRMKWDAASKYGQDTGLIFKQVGGQPKEQGMKVKGGGTVADLLVSLHERNLILDAGVNALPGIAR